MLADHLVGVPERQHPGQEAAVGAHGVLEMRERGARVPAGELRAPKLVVCDGEPFGLPRSLGGADGAEDTVLEVEHLTPLPGLDRELAATAQRAEVASPCLEDLPVERARLLGSAPRTRFVGAPEQLERERVVLRGRGRRTRKEITET